MKPDPNILAPRGPRIPQLACAALLLLLATRAVWHASRAETGWESIRHDWGRTLAGWFQIDKRALSEQEPEEQARFWLKEVTRLHAEKQPAGAAAGAAWMLDAPQAGFLASP